jgi:hypothetical protein
MHILDRQKIKKKKKKTPISWLSDTPTKPCTRVPWTIRKGISAACEIINAHMQDKCEN